MFWCGKIYLNSRQEVSGGQTAEGANAPAPTLAHNTADPETEDQYTILRLQRQQRKWSSELLSIVKDFCIGVLALEPYWSNIKLSI